MSKILKRWLDQYGAERFGILIFATIIKSVGLKGLIDVVIQEWQKVQEDFEKNWADGTFPGWPVNILF